MPVHYIAWWNVENLFDIDGAADRAGWLQRKLASELKGWNEATLARKIAQLASVITAMNQGAGPDILGLCEVENKTVLQKLADALAPLGRNYRIMHYAGNDQRGIDVAFMLDEDKYEIEPETFSYEVMKRAATRDIFQINIKTAKGRELILIGNHWPARSGGQYHSEPYRMMCGETLSYWMSRIMEIRGQNIPVLVMGDFNDEPFNRSLSEYAQSTPNRTRVNRGRLPYLYNLTQRLEVGEKGTYVFNNEPLFIDQMLVSKGIALKSSPFDLDRSSLKLFYRDDMIGGLYNTPVRYGRPSAKASYNPAGYSDHLPLVLELFER
jgi:predicted extracellular nuclease